MSARPKSQTSDISRTGRWTLPTLPSSFCDEVSNDGPPFLSPLTLRYSIRSLTLNFLVSSPSAPSIVWRHPIDILAFHHAWEGLRHRDGMVLYTSPCQSTPAPTSNINYRDRPILKMSFISAYGNDVRKYPINLKKRAALKS